MTKRVISIMLCLTMFLLSCVTCYANDTSSDYNPDEPITIKTLFEGTLLIQQGNYSGIIQMCNDRIVVMDSCLESPIIFSLEQYTDFDCKLNSPSSEHDTPCSIKQSCEKDLGTRAHTLIPLNIYETRRYSYAQIKTYISDGASLAGIAAIVLYLLSKAGFVIYGGITEALTVVGGIGNIIYFVIQGDENHGITLTLRKYKLVSEKYDETGIFYEWGIVNYGTY